MLRHGELENLGFQHERRLFTWVTKLYMCVKPIQPERFTERQSTLRTVSREVISEPNVKGTESSEMCSLPLGTENWRTVRRYWNYETTV